MGLTRKEQQEMFKKEKPTRDAVEEAILAKSRSKDASVFNKENIEQDEVFLKEKAMHPSAKAFFPGAFNNEGAD